MYPFSLFLNFLYIHIHIFNVCMSAFAMPLQEKQPPPSLHTQVTCAIRLPRFKEPTPMRTTHCYSECGFSGVWFVFLSVGNAIWAEGGEKKNKKIQETSSHTWFTYASRLLGERYVASFFLKFFYYFFLDTHQNTCLQLILGRLRGLKARWLTIWQVCEINRLFFSVFKRKSLFLKKKKK